MTKQLLIVVGIFISLNFYAQNNVFKAKQRLNSTSLLKKKIIGIWTSEGSINADFKIDKKTFYYVEDFAYYRYKMIGNNIKIFYPDYVYKAKIVFKNDTLILINKDYETKYWRFKD
jgi:hypothetical protein